MSDRAWHRSILLGFGILAVGYSLLMPMWEAPDEAAHYGYALHLAHEGKLPRRRHTYEAAQPPLYYWLASRVLVALDQIDPTLTDDYHPEVRPFGVVPRYAWNAINYRFLPGPQLLRWLNLLLGALTVHFVYLGARRFVPNPPAVAAGTASLVALSPQFLHLSTCIGNDPLANLAGGYLFWRLGALLSEAPSPTRALGESVVALCVPALTKLTVAPMALAFVAAAAWRTRPLWRKRANRRLLLGAMLSCTGIAAIAWWWVGLGGRFGRDLVTRALFVRPDGFDYLFSKGMWFARSYWGFLGWMSLGLPDAVVLVLTGLLLTGLLASAQLLVGTRSPAGGPAKQLILMAQLALVLSVGAASNTWIMALVSAAVMWALYRSFQASHELVPNGDTASKLLMLWMAVALTLLVVGKNTLATAQTQGRFLFPSIGAISVLAVVGWLLLAPRRLVPRLPELIALLMVSLNVFLWFRKVIPAYYQPLLD